MIKQFDVCSYFSSLVVVLTNTVFNDVESILVAPLKQKGSKKIINDLQIPCTIDEKEYFIDLLDIATLSKRSMKPLAGATLLELRTEIKAGLDLLIDGF